MASKIDFGKCSIEGFSNQTAHCSSSLAHEEKKSRLPSVYLGEILKYEVVIRRHNSVDIERWKKVMSKVSCQASFMPITTSVVKRTTLSSENDESTDSSVFRKTERPKTPQVSDNETTCLLLSTFVGAPFPSNVEESVTRPFFKDDDTFVIPMSSSLQSLAGAFSFIELRVTLCLFTLNFVSIPPNSLQESTGRRGQNEDSSASQNQFQGSEKGTPQKEAEAASNSMRVHQALPLPRRGTEMPCDEEEDEGLSETDSDSPIKVSSGYHTVHEKTVRQKFKVQGPPDLKMRLSSSGQKQFVLLTVGNNTEKQMVVKSIEMLSGSTPVQDCGHHFINSSTTKWESCHQLVSLEHPKKTVAFPAILGPCECLSLIFRLHLSSIPSDSELSLRCNLKWTHAGASNEITTVFKLPSIRVRCPPFIVTVKCDDQPVIDKPFVVTYNISNHLYDFMSMKLYYNLDNMRKNVADKGATVEERSKVRLVQESVVCQDPLIHTSSCPQGTSIPVRVGFQIHKPGLYEMSELMKVNLGYSLTDTSPDHHSSQSISTDTSSAMSLEDHLTASQQLWQNRSGSSTSLISPLLQSAEDKRRSFASKSYSFGDLGPSVSPDTSEAHNASRPRSIKRSSAVPPTSPAPPRMLSQTEKDLVQPSNFLKLPFYIYVKDPNC